VEKGRVARWFVFKPKIPTLVKFGGPWNGKCCYSLLPFGKIYGHLVVSGHLMYFLRFGKFGPRKIWQPWKR
jgi:hypothetical protein